MIERIGDATMAKTASVRIIKGPAGMAVYFDDTRVAGPKPWGGGTEIASFNVPLSAFTAVCDSEIERLEAALTIIRDTLPIETDNYSRHVFNIAAGALEPRE